MPEETTSAVADLRVALSNLTDIVDGLLVVTTTVNDPPMWPADLWFVCLMMEVPTRFVSQDTHV